MELEIWTNLRYGLEVEPVPLRSIGLGRWVGRSKNDLWIFSLSNWLDNGAILLGWERLGKEPMILRRGSIILF